jgi:hypothetical protein
VVHVELDYKWWFHARCHRSRHSGIHLPLSHPPQFIFRRVAFFILPLIIRKCVLHSR